MHLFWNSIKRAIIFFLANFILYKPLFLTLTLSCSGKLNPAAEYLRYFSFLPSASSFQALQLWDNCKWNLSLSYNDLIHLKFIIQQRILYNKQIILLSDCSPYSNSWKINWCFCFVLKNCATELFHLNSKYFSANIWPICWDCSIDVLLITGVRRFLKNRRIGENCILTEVQWLS